MAVEPDDIKWKLTPQVRQEMAALDEEIRRQFPALREAIRLKLCRFFNGELGCLGRMAGVNPLGAGPGGGKRIKLRVPLAGRGASRSLRMVVDAFCEERRVEIANVWLKRDGEDAE